MSITPTAIIRSASTRPYATWLALPAFMVGVLQNPSFGGSWVCSDHMSTEHNPTNGNATGSKRLSPGSFVRTLT